MITKQTIIMFSLVLLFGMLVFASDGRMGFSTASAEPAVPRKEPTPDTELAYTIGTSPGGSTIAEYSDGTVEVLKLSFSDWLNSIFSGIDVGRKAMPPSNCPYCWGTSGCVYNMYCSVDKYYATYSDCKNKVNSCSGGTPPPSGGNDTAVCAYTSNYCRGCSTSSAALQCCVNQFDQTTCDSTLNVIKNMIWQNSACTWQKTSEACGMQNYGTGCSSPSAEIDQYYCDFGYVYKCEPSHPNANNNGWRGVGICGSSAGLVDLGDYETQCISNLEVKSSSSDLCASTLKTESCSASGNHPSADHGKAHCVENAIYQCDNGVWYYYKSCSDYGNYECASSFSYITSDIGSLCKPKSGCANPLAIEGQFYCNLGYVHKCVNKAWSSIFQCGETGMTGDCKYGNKQVEPVSSGRDMCEVGVKQDNPCKNPPADDGNFKCVRGNIYQCDDGYWYFYKACSDYGSYVCTFSQDYVLSYIGKLCKEISGCSGPTANEGQYYCQNSNVLRCQTGVWNSVKQCQGICYNSVKDISEEVCYEATKKGFCVWEEKIKPAISEPTPRETFADGTTISSMDGKHIFECRAGEWKAYCERNNGNIYAPDMYYTEGYSILVCVDGKWVKSNDCAYKDALGDNYRYSEGYTLKKEDQPGSGQWYEYKCEKGQWVQLQKVQVPKCEGYKNNGEAQSKFNMLFVNKMTDATKEEFKSKTDDLINYLFDIPPFSGFESNFNVYLFSDNVEPTDIPEGCDLPNLYVVALDDSKSMYYSYAAQGGYVYLYTHEGELVVDGTSYTGFELGWVFVHEFGHLFGMLDDEYVYFPERTDLLRGGNCDNTVIKEENKPLICNLWVNYLGECIQGCTNEGYYRSSFDSIMRGGYTDKNNLRFNKVSQKILRDKLSKGIQIRSMMAAMSQEQSSVRVKLTLTKDGLNISGITLSQRWSDQKESEGKYTLKLLSDSNSALYETRFDLSLEINVFPPPWIFDSQGNQIDYPDVTRLDIATKILVVPYFEKASKIIVLENGQIVASSNIPFQREVKTEFKKEWLFYCAVIIVLLYILWEKGPKSGFFRRKK